MPPRGQVPWFVDETYVEGRRRVASRVRAVDEHCQVIDVLVSRYRDIAAARAFFVAAVLAYGQPEKVVNDRSAALTQVIAELLPGHNTEQYANSRVERDHGRRKAQLRPMRAVKTTGTVDDHRERR